MRYIGKVEKLYMKITTAKSINFQKWYRENLMKNSMRKEKVFTTLVRRTVEVLRVVERLIGYH